MFAPTPMEADVQQERSSRLDGHLQRLCALRPGLSLHADDAVDHWDMAASGVMEAGLRILVLLEGSVDVSYGDRRLMVGCAGPRAARAVLVNMLRPEPFVRRLRKGRHARRVSVSVSEQWLRQIPSDAQEEQAIGEFMRHHLAVHTFEPSSRLVALAGQLSAVPGHSPVLRHLYLESRALEFVAEALADLVPLAYAPWSQSLRPREFRRMTELREFLRSDEALGLSLQTIARQIGMHPNTMQRHFRAQYGTTVVEFVREARFQRARMALEGDGVSVAQAAEIAGYTSAANFATAFRRRFGHSPKLARLR